MIQRSCDCSLRLVILSPRGSSHSGGKREIKCHPIRSSPYEYEIPHWQLLTFVLILVARDIKGAPSPYDFDAGADAGADADVIDRPSTNLGPTCEPASRLLGLIRMKVFPF